MNRIRFDWLALGIIIVVGLWLTDGDGLLGILVLIAAAAALGGIFGLVGRRYPLIYRQNRRDRRRDSH